MIANWFTNSAANAVQFTCMKTVPFRTLEDAVEAAGNDFVPVQDGTGQLLVDVL